MRLISRSAAAVATGLLCCSPALAAIPVISGEYVSTTWVYCQPTLSVQHGGNAVDAVNLSEAAPSSYSVALESYDSNTGVMTTKGVETGASGSSLLLNDSANGVSGSPFTASQSLPPPVLYSNTLATVTIGSATYHVEWGLKKKNVAQYFVLLNVAANGCVTQSEKVLK